MDSNTLPEQVAGGVDQRYFPAANAAQLVQNFRYEPNGGWRNDRGWEPLIPYPSPWNPTLAEIGDLYQTCRFLTVVQRHQGGEEYYLQERNGNLFYEFGNQGTATTNKIILDKDRNIPRSDDPGTQAVPYGRFVALLNGYDNMLKFWGRARTTQFGFYQTPPAPTTIELQMDYNSSETNPPAASATDNDLAGVSIQFPADSQLGLGDPTGGSVNTYSYRQTYITDTGSESPLSPPCTVNWTIPTGDSDLAKANQRKYGVMLVGFDPGPDGTVARRIYRTKNKKDGIAGSGDIYYFVAQLDENNTTTYVDVTPDNQLTVPAPGINDSVTISTSYKYGASWNGSFWLAGGESTPTRMIYSAQGLPEQFPAFNYFDVGVRDGGHITALYPYYDVLLVFRERSIDAVFTNATGDGYTCTTVKKDCGTTATNSIKLIPGYGIMFINKDGFWLIKGGMRGGAQIDIINMSQTIEKEMGRLSKNALARVSAAYSDREKEYWCIYPVDGETECTRGACWNIVNEQWSFRGAGDDQNINHKWKFSQIATDQSGYFILGTAPVYSTAFPILSNAFPGLGLQVWSGRTNWGDDVTITLSQQGVYTLTPVPYAQGQSTWTSTWYDFGDDSVKKRILTVEMEVITEGNNPIDLQWAQDWGYTYTSAGSVPIQIGDYLGGKTEQTTYSPAALTTVKQTNIAVWDTSKWEEPRVTRLRWDVNTGLVSQFQFRILSSNHMQIVKYQINYIGGSVKTPNTRMPGAKQ
jgi:hypothetical protein